MPPLWWVGMTIDYKHQCPVCLEEYDCEEDMQDDEFGPFECPLPYWELPVNHRWCYIKWRLGRSRYQVRILWDHMWYDMRPAYEEE